MRSLLRTPSRTLFEPGRMTKLMSFRLNLASEDSIPSGLMNGGNTCFVNSVLQCLVNTQPLQVFLTSSEHSKCPLAAGHGHLVKVNHSFCPICNMKENVSLLLDPRYCAILPRDLLLSIDKIGEFRLGDQEDAHQFLLDMLVKMHDAFVYVDEINRKLLEGTNTKKVNHGPNRNPKTTAAAAANAPIDYEDRALVEQSSFIYQMFGGKFLDKTRCVECGTVTMRPDPFLVLSLALSSGASVEEALRNFCKIEVVLKTDESLICGKCDKRVTVQRQTTFWQAPEILTIHLKRFDNSGRKINKSVAFSQTLNFSDVISRDSPAAQQGATTYSLYAMIAHYGPFIGAGHYVAFAKLDGQWYLFDDKDVHGINESIVMKQNAYILFYKKNEPQAPASTAVATSLRTSAGGSSISTPSSSTPSNASSSANSLRSSASGPKVTPSPNTSAPSNAEVAQAASNLEKLAITRLTPPHHVYLTQEGDEMKDVTLRIHLPQLETVNAQDLRVTLTQSGRFEFSSSMYYLLFELVFPLEPSQSKAVYYEQDRSFVVFAPIAQDSVESQEPITLSCQVNTERMSEDDYTFLEESLLPVDPILGVEEQLSEEEEKRRKGQEKIEALNMETATYRELHENIRELKRNPQRMTQGQQAPASNAPAAKKTGAPLPGASKRIKPNEPCPCGSTKKYKTCHGKGL